MKNDPLEKKAMEAFKQFMDAEISRPEIEQQKRLFIQRNFPMKPAWARFAQAGAPVLVPALAAFGLFVLFQTGFLRMPSEVSQTQGPQVPGAVAPLVTVEAPLRIEVTPAKKLKKIKIKEASVSVKSASSETGQTMVYQRQANDKPVTIVWVFTGKGMSS